MILILEVLVGIEIGWIAPTIIKLQNGETDFIPTDAEISWIASIHEIGRIFGTIFSAILLDKIGRKYTLIISSFSFAILWLAVSFASSPLIICSLRVLLGLVMGLNDVTSSIYIAENYSPKIRGIISSFLPVCFYGGIIFEYILATFMSYTTMNLVNTIIACVAVLSGFLLKDTPYFLVMKDRFEDAEKNLYWLRAGGISTTEVKMELEKIQQGLKAEKLKKEPTFTVLTKKENLKSILFIMGVYLLIMFTGIASINSYVSTILQSSNTLTRNEYTIIFGVFQLMGTCITPFIIERINRRTMLITALLIMGLCQACTCILYVMQFDVWCAYFPWLIFVTVTTYATIFAASYSVTFIIRSEILPTSVRAIGGSLVIMIDSMAAFAVIKLYVPVNLWCGIQYNYLFYFISSIVGAVYIFILLPETRGKSLIDIEMSLKTAQ